MFQGWSEDLFPVLSQVPQGPSEYPVPELSSLGMSDYVSAQHPGDCTPLYPVSIFCTLSSVYAASSFPSAGEVGRVFHLSSFPPHDSSSCMSSQFLNAQADISALGQVPGDITVPLHQTTPCSQHQFCEADSLITNPKRRLPLQAGQQRLTLCQLPEIGVHTLPPTTSWPESLPVSAGDTLTCNKFCEVGLLLTGRQEGTKEG